MQENQHILIVEDDSAIAKPLQTGLQREGFMVAWRSRGEEGIRYACDHHPHLILLDVRLPDGSGFDFCAQLRKLGISVPIIILTVKRDEVDKVLGLEMGADDYITKPFSFKELVSRIRAQLRRAYGELSTSGAVILRVGELIIDQSSGKVRRGEQSINLSPIGFRLLIYFARRDDTTEVILIFAAIAGSMLISYIRARAEGLGLDAEVGIMRRTMRVCTLALGLLINQVLIFLWILAILTHFTAWHRLFYVWRRTRKLQNKQD